MCLAEVLVAVGVATVVSHVDGRHLGDVQRAVIPKVLEHRKEDSGGENPGKQVAGKRRESV